MNKKLLLIFGILLLSVIGIVYFLSNKKVDCSEIGFVFLKPSEKYMASEIGRGNTIVVIVSDNPNESNTIIGEAKVLRDCKIIYDFSMGYLDTEVKELHKGD